MGLSGERTSPQSMNTCFESEPQMPVRRGRVTTQSGKKNPGSSISTSFIGVCARLRSNRLSVSGTVTGSGFTP